MGVGVGPSKSAAASLPKYVWSAGRFALLAQQLLSVADITDVLNVTFSGGNWVADDGTFNQQVPFGRRCYRKWNILN